MKIVYGPVASWRLGKSLGVDVICTKNKICSFDCTYCQLPYTERITAEQQSFINVNEMKQELSSALDHTSPDIITLSGMGEPTLASNLKDIIKGIRDTSNIPIALLTNSTVLYQTSLQEILQNIDIIVAKLDASNKTLFQKINQPAHEITFEKTLEGIHSMRQNFSGRFDLQMMFIQENKDAAEDMAELARGIDPDYVQLNTPLRPCPVPPLSEEVLDHIETYFSKNKTLSVYHSTKPKTTPLDKMDMIQRRRMEK